jgi:methionyl-tRNA formyltransferase
LADPQAITATATRPLTKADFELDWHWPARRIVNVTRSLSPAPGARADIDGVHVKILRAKTDALGETRPRPTGTAFGKLLGVEGDAAVVACGDGAVLIERLVPPSRASVDGKTFAMPRLS